MARQVTTVSISLSPQGLDALRRIAERRFGSADRRTSATIEQLILEEMRRIEREEKREGANG